MKIYIFDTEYLSWSRKQSDTLAHLRPKYQQPELIQIFIQEVFTKYPKHKLLYIKPKYFKIYPHRISKLTGIKKKFLDKKGLDFKKAYKNLVSYIPKNSLLISNGDDYKILESNIKLNSIKKINKKIFILNFYNLIKNHSLFEKYKNYKNINTEIIKKILKIKIKSHNAKNDVKVLYSCLKKISLKKLDLKKYYKYRKLYKV